MKSLIPPSKVIQGHPDHALLSAIKSEIIRRAGGEAQFKSWFAQMLRDSIDFIIETPKTGRRLITELASTEKTYLGTRVEIEIKGELILKKGKLDAIILGHDVDIKNTIGSTWMIPREAIGHPMILVASDENTAKFYVGLMVAHTHNLTAGQNQDKKNSVSAAGFSNILWLFNGESYPRNFWMTLPPKTVAHIVSQPNGNARITELFRTVQRKPIDRSLIDATARQKDFMRRTRSDKTNGRKGTRDILAEEGMLVLNGHYDKKLIADLGLPKCGQSQFISYTVKDAADVNLASKHGKKVTPP